MELLEESGILCLLVKCDGLITEVQEFEFETFFNFYFNLYGKFIKTRENFGNIQEFKGLIKFLMENFANFEFERFSKQKLSIHIDHLESPEDYFKKFSFKLYYYDSIFRSRLDYNMARSQNYESYNKRGKTERKTLQQLSEERGTLMLDAYLNMDTQKLVNYLSNSDLSVYINHVIQEESIERLASTVQQWIAKIKNHLGYKKIFIPIDIGYLLPEYIAEINIIKQLKKEGFEIRQLSFSDIEHISK